MYVKIPYTDVILTGKEFVGVVLTGLFVLVAVVKLTG
jgi:hypothetical protein